MFPRTLTVAEFYGEKVYGHAGLQQLLNDGRIVEEGDAFGPRYISRGRTDLQLPDQTGLQFPQQFGIFRPQLAYEERCHSLGDGNRVPANLVDEECAG